MFKPSYPMKFPSIGSICLFVLGSLVALPLSLMASGYALPVWPPPTVPPGGNPAVIPATSDGWMEHFDRILARTKKGGVNLIFDGDSITDFWQGAGKVVWEKNYARLGAVDDGISGDKTENLLWRLEDGQVDGVRPKLVVLMIGTNNLGRDKDEQIAAGIEKIVQEYQTRLPNAVLLLQGIFPRGEVNDPYRARIKHINSLIAHLGDGKKVIYLDLSDKFLSPDGTLSKDIFPDGLHPSEKGYEIWAAAIQPVVAQVFGGNP